MNGASEAEAATRMALTGAEVVTRIALSGSVFVIRAAGKGTAHLINFLAAAAKGNEKTAGKERLAALLRSGSQLKVYTFKQEQMKEFMDAAKRYGVVYSVVKRDASDKEQGIFDVMVKAEDAAKLERIFTKMNYATVDGEITSNESTEEESQHIDYIRDLIDKMMQPGRNQENPLLAVEGENLSTASYRSEDDRPSVKEAIESFKENQQINMEDMMHQNQNIQPDPVKDMLGKMLQPENKEQTVQQNDLSADKNASMDIKDKLQFLVDADIDTKGKVDENTLYYIHSQGFDVNKDGYVYTSDIFATTKVLMNTLGINRDRPTKQELNYVEGWIKHGFSADLIKSAGEKAVETKQGVGFAYVNGIINNWGNSNVRTVEDLDRLKSSSKNSFNNFQQTKMDDALDEMEQLFLKEVNRD